ARVRTPFRIQQRLIRLGDRPCRSAGRRLVRRGLWRSHAILLPLFRLANGAPQPLMLQPAHVGHLALLRSLIREGAAEGSFDRELAAESDEATDFFEKLKRALVTGYFVEQDPRSGRIE